MNRSYVTEDGNFEANEIKYVPVWSKQVVEIQVKFVASKNDFDMVRNYAIKIFFLKSQVLKLC